ncbi:Asparagine synthetase [Caenispirillum salinarum AK4]|uniref:asparagine synthase (glutamine-hydrolyzing) n=1 Tax=Caenispirillum salinarum AK4 TaxID=1238182 RepID=K9HX54_9PROT|nr:XrtA/PEP-CTERM system amidotransferase [Caenispirillum salinarum]EKV32741.1 Asparagine synthetase [Caenispirillum salinarum AK4]
MCGIVGIYHARADHPVDQALLHAMNESQHHRGPDGGGLFAEDGVGLGHRRLSIIDVGGGAQPLFNEDGSVVVVYNGEIYNFAELFEELRARGHVFRTHCDTEAIVHAWEEWGEDCVRRFRGMFAFAIWDRRRHTLFLARDRLGIKPLYWARTTGGALVFGSELKSLLCHPGLSRAIDPLAVEDYFAYGYVPDPRTIYQSVHKLEPGHTLCIRRDDPAPPCPRQYWDVSFGAGGPRRMDDAVGELRARLKEAVGIRMIAEVPLGAFLSGGVDSSGVVAMMARQSSDPVDTCSIGFAQVDHDESPHAAKVAERWKTNHRTRRVDPDSFDLIDSLAAMYDEPFADSSAMPTFRVCQLAREKVTVALSGDGGDEVFAGYRRHRWHALEERVRGLVPPGMRRPVFGALGALYPKMDWAPKPLRAKTTFQALGRETVEGYFHAVSVLPDHLRARLYSPGLKARLGAYHAADVLRRHMEAAPTDHPLSRVQYADMKTYLPGDILTKVDRTSMAVALEVRVPLLDHHFVEWAGTVPPEMKLIGREGKAVLKKALEPDVPHDVLYRPKMGFAVPLAKWLRGPLKDRLREAVNGPVLADSGLFDRAFLSTLAEQHISGRNDHSAALWSVLMFEAFLRRQQAEVPVSLGTDTPPGPRLAVPAE